LIEHYAGAFPVWLSPVQVAIIPISDEQADYATQVSDLLQAKGIRVEMFQEAETMQNRIRKAESDKIPYMLILGRREAEAGTVSVRQRGQKDLGVMSQADFIDKITQEIEVKFIEAQ